MSSIMPHQSATTSYGLSDPARNTAARARHPVECVDERRIMERHDMETALKNQVKSVFRGSNLYAPI